ncbi:MAG TPA: TetR/AcrR family transcriptional regulator [Alphaproteobacteria bacterium]|nr:TetR/AcrR family transcriptional regulator [Alphaproteobacteria bacterium]
MTKKKAPNLEKKICDAALKCAATHDWASVTLAMIAKAVKLSPTQVTKLFSTTGDILPALVRQTDAEVANSVGKLHGTPHDKLFEVMMARFDYLQTHRDAILNIMGSVKRDPSLARHLLPAGASSMQAMLALAGLKQDEPKNILAVTGLLAIYAIVLCVWERDESDDMAKTMAALDRHLRRAGKLADILFRAF